MPLILPSNIIANADDFGLSSSVNNAILSCYEHGYINSATLMTNMPGFEDAVELARKNDTITNLGVHINLYTGKPVSNFLAKDYLLANGEFSEIKAKKVLKIFDSKTSGYFFNEIAAQVKKATDAGIKITHLDSHHHLHTLPALFPIFLKFAKQHKLKLRLAQTYSEGNYLKYKFRSYINGLIKKAGCNYSDKFETVEYFVKNSMFNTNGSVIEIMLHPGLTDAGELTDHYSPSTMSGWIECLNTLRS